MQLADGDAESVQLAREWAVRVARPAVGERLRELGFGDSIVVVVLVRARVQ